MTTASLSSLPLELIQEVVANHQAVPLHTSDPYYDSLEPPPALHPLLLVNSAFYHAVVPVLWRHIDTSRMSNLSVMRLQDVLLEKLSIFRATGALSVCCCSIRSFTMAVQSSASQAEHSASRSIGKPNGVRPSSVRDLMASLRLMAPLLETFELHINAVLLGEFDVVMSYMRDFALTNVKSLILKGTFSQHSNSYLSHTFRSWTGFDSATLSCMLVHDKAWRRVLSPTILERLQALRIRGPMLPNWSSLTRLITHSSCRLRSIELDNVHGPSFTEAVKSLSTLTQASKPAIEEALHRGDASSLLSVTNRLQCPVQDMIFSIRLSAQSQGACPVFWSVFLTAAATCLQSLTLPPALATTDHIAPLLSTCFDGLQSLVVGQGPASSYFAFGDAHDDWDDAWLDGSDAGDSHMERSFADQLVIEPQAIGTCNQKGVLDLLQLDPSVCRQLIDCCAAPGMPLPASSSNAPKSGYRTTRLSRFELFQVDLVQVLQREQSEAEDTSKAWEQTLHTYLGY